MAGKKSRDLQSNQQNRQSKNLPPKKPAVKPPAASKSAAQSSPSKSVPKSSPAKKASINPAGEQKTCSRENGGWKKSRDLQSNRQNRPPKNRQSKKPAAKQPAASKSAAQVVVEVGIQVSAGDKENINPSRRAKNLQPKNRRLEKKPRLQSNRQNRQSKNRRRKPLQTKKSRSKKTERPVQKTASSKRGISCWPAPPSEYMNNAQMDFFPPAAGKGAR